MDAVISQSELQHYTLTFFHFFFSLPEVTKILLFAAQASHQLVPPEVSTPRLGDVKNGQWASVEI